jgi:hypothetical protein
MSVQIPVRLFTGVRSAYGRLATVNETAREFLRLRAAVERRLPGTAPFRPGATDHDLERLAAATGLVLPDDLRALLRASDGQDDPGQLYGPLNFHHFLTIDEIIEMHHMLTDAVGDMATPVEQPAHYRWTVWSGATDRVVEHEPTGPGRRAQARSVVLRVAGPPGWRRVTGRNAAVTRPHRPSARGRRR